MIRAIFGLASMWEISRFALLFFFVYSALGREAPEFAATVIWFGSSQLVVAAALLFAMIKPARLRDVSLNLVRIGKALATLTGGVAFFSRMYQSLLAGTVAGPVDWLRQEPIVLIILAVDFTLVLFLLSYRPGPDPDAPIVRELPDYDVTDLEEE